MVERSTCKFCGRWLLRGVERECRTQGCPNKGCDKCIPLLNPTYPEAGGYCIDCSDELAKKERHQDGLRKP